VGENSEGVFAEVMRQVAISTESTDGPMHAARLDAVRSILHCLNDGRAGAVVLQDLLLAQDVAESFDGVSLVKVGDGVDVVSLDVTDNAVAVRSQVGVEMYKCLRGTVLVVDADPNAQVLVVLHSDELDVLEKSHLDLLVAVRAIWLFFPFGWLEDGVLRTLLFTLGDSTESPCSRDLALRHTLHDSSFCNRVKMFDIITFDAHEADQL